MFRRAAFIATLLMLMSAASVSAAGHTVNITATAYKPAAVTLALCDTVAWHNKTAKKRTLVSSSKFLPPNAIVNAGATSSPLQFTQAGTYSYHDATKTALKGTIKVAPTVTPDNGTTATQFQVTIACTATPGQFTHDIQVRVNGGPWQARGGTSAQVFKFVATGTGVWDIQTRYRYLLSGGQTDWSPMVTVAVN
jgi:plastocyanin